MAEPSRAPVYAQVPLWDWPLDETPVAASPAQPAQEAAGQAGQASQVAPTATVLERPAAPDGPGEEPAVAEALGVITRSLAGMAATETRPLLDEPSKRYRLRRFDDTDLAVFPVILGGSTFGWTASADATTAILDTYTEAGGNAVDTADSYAAGRSETLIGAWLRSRRNRDGIVLSTKVSRSAEHPGLSAQSIVRATEASLARLGVETVDLLYFHFDDPDVPLEESLTAADSLVRSGKVRYLAASNYAPDRLMEARITAGQLMLPRFVAVQAHYNLVHRAEYEKDLLPIVRAQGLAVVPYFALANGFLTGKYRGRSKEARGSDAHSRAVRVEQYLNKRGFRVLDALEDVAEQQGVSMSTAAVSWLLTKPLVTAPVVSASRPEQVAEIVGAASVHLSRSQVTALDRASQY